MWRILQVGTAAIGRLCRARRRRLRELRSRRAIRPAAAPGQRRQGAGKTGKGLDEFTGGCRRWRPWKSGLEFPANIDKVAFTEGGQVSAATCYRHRSETLSSGDRSRGCRFEAIQDFARLARIELTRVQRLKDSGAVSQEELDERKSTVAQAEANSAGAAAALEAATLNLNFTRVTSR